MKGDCYCRGPIPPILLRQDRAFSKASLNHSFELAPYGGRRHKDTSCQSAYRLCYSICIYLGKGFFSICAVALKLFGPGRALRDSFKVEASTKMFLSFSASIFSDLLQLIENDEHANSDFLRKDVTNAVQLVLCTYQYGCCLRVRSKCTMSSHVPDVNANVVYFANWIEQVLWGGRRTDGNGR